MNFTLNLVKTNELYKLDFNLNVSDFVKQDQFKASVNKSNFVIIHKLEVNDTINTVKHVNTIDVPSSGDDILGVSNNTVLVDNVDNTDETMKDVNDPFANAMIINITTELLKDKGSKVTTINKTKTLQTKTKDCTLLKWFFVCRDFRVLKDKDIFAV